MHGRTMCQQALCCSLRYRQAIPASSADNNRLVNSRKGLLGNGIKVAQRAYQPEYRPLLSSERSKLQICWLPLSVSCGLPAPPGA